MIQQTPEVDKFKQQLRDSLARETANYRAIKIKKHRNIYNVGDNDEQIYFIEKGQVKLVMTSTQGKECLLAIHTDGDIFGELCLSQLSIRMETAIAMRDSIVKHMPSDKFLLLLETDKLANGFIRYLAVRVADQQQVIANLVTVDSEQRLGQILLQLARTMGKKDPNSILIPLRISHEELSAMVGTTRPRISLFLQRFRNLNLIELSKDNFFIIKEHRLDDYLAQISK